LLVRNSRLTRRVTGVLIALILSGAAAAVVLPRAAAASVIPTQLAISVSPPRVSYPNPQVTITGTLETFPTNGQSAQPIAGETIALSLLTENGYLSQPLGSVVTNASGKFSTTTTSQVPGLIEGHFAGDATYRESYGGAGFKAASQLPTKVTVEPIKPTPYGSTVNVTAQVSMQLANGTWVPAPGSPIELTGCGPSGGQSGWANGQGQWTVAIQAVPPLPGDLECSFYTDGDSSNSWTQWVLSPQFVIPLATFPTQVVNLDPLVTAANNRIPAADIVFGGGAQWEDSAGTQHPFPGATVQLYFAYGGTGPWQLMATAVTNKSGNFTFTRLSGYLSGGRLAAGIWKAVLPAQSVYVAGQSGNYYGVLAVPVSFGGLKITGASSIRYLSGTLQYLPKGGLLHGEHVTLLTNVNGKIHSGPTVTTGGSGTFSLRLTAPKPGQRVKYAASFAGGGSIPGLTTISAYVVLNPARSGWLAWP
jgi:hypothetical protein